MQLLLALITLAGALAAGAMSPGPSFLLVARLSVGGSRREGLAAAAGMGAGAGMLAIAVMLGLHALLTRFGGLFVILKIVGALYLIHLSLDLWRSSRRSAASSGGALQPDAAESPDHQGRPSAFRRALLTQISNPKALVVYGSVIAAVLPTNLSPAVAGIVLILVLVIETGWYAIVALALSAEAPRAAYLRGRRIFDRVAAGVMGLLGLRLLLATTDTR